MPQAEPMLLLAYTPPPPPVPAAPTTRVITLPVNARSVTMHAMGENIYYTADMSDGPIMLGMDSSNTISNCTFIVTGIRTNNIASCTLLQTSSSSTIYTTTIDQINWGGTATSNIAFPTWYSSVGGVRSAEQERHARAQLRQYKKDEARRTTRARSAIKRAWSLISGVGLEPEVRIFLSGEQMEVHHPDSLLKFVMRRQPRHSILDSTKRPGHSTPYSLELWTKTDIRVAYLCVVLEDTPILDQLLGIAMFIRTGDEEMILRKANWSNYGDLSTRAELARTYPALADKFVPDSHGPRVIETLGHYNIMNADTLGIWTR